jgi:hypothetical protein
MIPGTGCGRLARLAKIEAEIHAVSRVLQLALNIDKSELGALKKELRSALPGVSSSHLSEAMAAGLEFTANRVLQKVYEKAAASYGPSASPPSRHGWRLSPVSRLAVSLLWQGQRAPRRSA